MEIITAILADIPPLFWLGSATLLLLALLLLLLLLLLRQRRLFSDMEIVEVQSEGREAPELHYGDEPEVASLPLFTPRQQELREALTTALARREPFFQLHVQPIYRLRDGRLLGGEVLMRWEHPELGPLSPGEFIPVAEMTGQIIQLDRLVLAEVIARLGEEPTALLTSMQLAVNVSIQHFRDVALVHHIQALCEKYEVPMKGLELEVTEHARGDDLEQIQRSMRLVRSHGIGLALDDFGTGFTSLRFLQSLPFSKVKLDRSYVCRIDREQQTRRLIACLIEMIHTLEMRCVAEGIEEREELEQLRRMGCEAGQGYLLERPMPMEDFLTLARGSLLFKGQPLRDSVETITRGAVTSGEERG